MTDNATRDPVCCGITIAARRAVLVFLRREGDLVRDVTGQDTRITIRDEDNPSEIRAFCGNAHALFDRMQPDHIGIVQRKKKGHFASGGTTFKLEGLLQLYPRTDVALVAPTLLRQFVKEQRPILTPRFQYQKEAYLLALYLLETLGPKAG